MNGLHPRFAKCKLVAIKFDEKLTPWVEMLNEHGAPMIVTATACLEGVTLREVLRLARGLTVIDGGKLVDKLSASVESARRLREKR